MTTLSAKPTKSQAVVNGLVAHIRSGELRAGDKLLPTDQLAAHYGVSVPTAHKAVRELVDRGLVVRRSGAGTFVTDSGADSLQPTAVTAAAATVGLLLCGGPHHWDDVNRCLMIGLRDLAASPMAVDISELSAEQIAALPAFQHLVAQQPDVVVITTRAAQEAVRDHLPAARIIALLIDSLPPVVQILPNFLEVGRLCGAHLAAQGYDRIDFMDVAVAPDYPTWQTWGGRQIQQGLTESLRLAGSDFGRTVHLMGPINSPATDEQIREYLQSPDRAPALVCRFSHRSMQVWRQAQELGLSIPGDLALMSTLDTPWTQDFGISAVDQRFADMAACCVRLLRDILAGGDTTSDTVQHLITPALCPRTSTSRP